MNKINVETDKLDIATLKYQTIEKYLNMEITRHEAAAILKVTPNYIYTLANKFDSSNEFCYVSKKKGVSVNKKVDTEMEQRILQAFRDCCKLFKDNGTHVKGRPEEWFTRPTYQLFYESISKWCIIGKTRVTSILKINGLLSSRCRSTEAKPPISVSNKKRGLLAGQEIQLDGKTGIIFAEDNFECVAHMAVDASSNCILGIIFDKGETNNGYIKLLKNVWSNYGIPQRIVTDGRASFISSAELGDKNVVIAQAATKLFIELIVTSNAKRKNKVENKNDTIQVRIIPYLKMLGVKTMKHANEVINIAIAEANAKLKNNITSINAFTPLPIDTDLDTLFSIQSLRTADKYSQILYKKEKYFLITSNQEIKRLKKGQKVTITEDFNGNLLAKYKGNIYSLVLATQENLNKYKVIYTFKHRKIYKNERNDFIFNGTVYHIIDNDGKPVKIKSNSSIVKVYNEHNELLHITMNKIMYFVQLGPSESNEFFKKPSEVIMINPSIKFDGTFTYNKTKYYIRHNNKITIFPAGSKIEVIVEKGIPSHVRHKKMLLTCHNSDIKSPDLYLPKSNHEATKYYNRNQNRFNII